ncbi:MAG: site-specific DNA-methyltransferase [Phycisphaerales bacterium]|nr:site-specific DNA-methyltransferase [Phycisphaerales bacterium]
MKRDGSKGALSVGPLGGAEAALPAPTRRIIEGENLQVVAALPAAFARLIYIDPPFNTGHEQQRKRIRVKHAADGERRHGFHGRRYSVTRLASPSYQDRFGDSYLDVLMPRLEAGLRCLTPDGSLMVHLDANEVHYVKVALDELLGRDRFMNEIIWAYDYGARPRTRWPAKHDTILWYALDPRKGRYVFNYDEIDRIPYMAPRLVGADKAERGKTPTDVWWNTIVPTNSREKTGYPTQKPLSILERIVRVHSNPRDTVLDFFAGSGTTGEAAARHDRGFVLVDSSAEACAIMRSRLAAWLNGAHGAPRDA